MLLLVLVGSAGSAPCASVQSCQNTTLWHLPGPNPLISPGAKLSWMSTECEVAGGVTKVNATYYCLYHCLGTNGYRVGISTADSPLGPWTPPASEPVLDVTEGAWDADVVASMNILPDCCSPDI